MAPISESSLAPSFSAASRAASGSVSGGPPTGSFEAPRMRLDDDAAWDRATAGGRGGAVAAQEQPPR